MAERSVEAFIVDRCRRRDDFHLGSIESRNTSEVVEGHLPPRHVLGTEERLESRPLVGEEIERDGDGTCRHWDVGSPSSESFEDRAGWLAIVRHGEWFERESERSVGSINRRQHRNGRDDLDRTGVAAILGGFADDMFVDGARITVQRRRKMLRRLGRSVRPRSGASNGGKHRDSLSAREGGTGTGEVFPQAHPGKPQVCADRNRAMVEVEHAARR